MKIIILDGAGKMTSKVSNYFCKQGNEVIVFDDKDSKVKLDKKIKFINKPDNILNFLPLFLKNTDLVMDFSHKKIETSQELDTEVSTYIKLLDILKEENVKKFLWVMYETHESTPYDIIKNNTVRELLKISFKKGLLPYIIIPENDSFFFDFEYESLINKKTIDNFLKGLEKLINSDTHANVDIIITDKQGDKND